MMARHQVRFTAELWEWNGEGSWHFVSVPEEVSDEIEAMFGHRSGGFGSVKVEVTVGRTTWQTSLFPDRKRETYILPMKKAVRTAERLQVGLPALITLTVLI
jgi:hypothetical protein